MFQGGGQRKINLEGKMKLGCAGFECQAEKFVWVFDHKGVPCDLCKQGHLGHVKVKPVALRCLFW